MLRAGTSSDFPAFGLVSGSRLRKLGFRALPITYKMFYATYEDALGLYDIGQMLFFAYAVRAPHWAQANRLGHGPLSDLL